MGIITEPHVHVAASHVCDVEPGVAAVGEEARGSDTAADGSDETCVHPAGHGYVGDKAALLSRLRRAEGQVRGIQRMINDDEYCIDIITQVSAATKALETVALSLLDDHLKHCVAQATRQGGEVADQKLDEASKAIARLVRS